MDFTGVSYVRSLHMLSGIKACLLVVLHLIKVLLLATCTKFVELTKVPWSSDERPERWQQGGYENEHPQWIETSFLNTKKIKVGARQNLSLH